MAFQIPAKTFLSFGRKQCLDTLYRIGLQLQLHFTNEVERGKALASIDLYLNALKDHEDDYIKIQAGILNEIKITDEAQLQYWIMHLERELELDLKHEDFEVSTRDTEKIKEDKIPIHLVLDNLRSALNVGTLIRTAEAYGVSHIHFCGYTPTPENAKVAKSSLGTEEWIEWRYWENSLECIDYLKSENIKTYALETAAGAKSLETIEPAYPCAIVLGNERYGLGEPVLRRCEELVAIPLRGRKNSLNVGTCGAIVLNHLSLTYKS